MMKKIRHIGVCLLAVLLSCSLASCGAGSKTANESFAVGTDTYWYSEQMENVAVEGKPGAADSPTLSNDMSTNRGDAEFASKIIRRVELQTETREYDKALAELDRLISENGGYLESSNSNGQSLDSSGIYRRSARFVIRIPAEKLDAFLASTNQLFNVTSSYITSENVTAAYYDIQSRLEVLRTEKDTLNGMLEKAKTVEEMLKIQDRLYNVIAEIESAETSLRLYDSLVSYSTVTMRVDEVVEYTRIIEEEPSWGQRLWDAFVESWKDFADGFQDFTVGLLYAIPTLLVLAVIVVPICLISRFMFRKRKAAKAQKQANRTQDTPRDRDE